MTTNAALAEIEDPFAQPSASRTTVDPEGDNAAYSFDGKPDRWKRYRLPDPITGEPGGYTRATTFAKSTSDTYTLSKWSQRKVIEGLVNNDDVYASACALDFDDKDSVNSLAETAKNAAGAKAGANLGTAIHAYSESIDRGESPRIPPKLRGHVAAWTAILQDYNMEVLAIEKRVLHPGLDDNGVAGTLDRVVRFTKDTKVKLKQGRKWIEHTFPAGAMAILDLKTGRDLSYGWMEIAVQLVVYADAPHVFSQPDGPGTDWAYQPNWDVDKKVALVVHIPAQETVGRAVLYAVDLTFGREAAELCTQVRRARKRKGVAVEVAVMEVKPTATKVLAAGDVEPAEGLALESRHFTFEERVGTAVTEQELADIWFEAVNARKDTRALSAIIVAKKKDLRAETAGG